MSTRKQVYIPVSQLTPEQHARRKEIQRKSFHKRKAEVPERFEKRRLKEKNQINRKVRLWKRAAKDRSIEIKITDEQAKSLFIKPCHYCGYLPTEGYNGIDRKDNEPFYDETNSLPALLAI